MDTDVNRGAVGFLSLDPFDINNIFCSITLDYFTDLLTLIVTSDHLSGDNTLAKQNRNSLWTAVADIYLDLIILSDWNTSDAIFLSQLFAERRRHYSSSDM